MTKWQDIKALCSEEKILWQDDYYRMRQLSADSFEIARLVPGVCGEYTYHPKITVKLEHEMFVPMNYFDNTDSPVQQISRDMDESFLDQAFVILLESCLQAKKQQLAERKTNPTEGDPS